MFQVKLVLLVSLLVFLTTSAEKPDEDVYQRVLNNVTNVFTLLEAQLGRMEQRVSLIERSRHGQSVHKWKLSSAHVRPRPTKIPRSFLRSRIRSTSMPSTIEYYYTHAVTTTHSPLFTKPLPRKGKVRQSAIKSFNSGGFKNRRVYRKMKRGRRMHSGTHSMTTMRSTDTPSTPNVYFPHAVTTTFSPLFTNPPPKAMIRKSAIKSFHSGGLKSRRVYRKMTRNRRVHKGAHDKTTNKTNHALLGRNIARPMQVADFDNTKTATRRVSTMLLSRGGRLNRMKMSKGLRRKPAAISIGNASTNTTHNKPQMVF